MKLAIVVLSLLILPSAYALSCSNVLGKDVELCNEITQSTLSNEIKQQLIADLIYTDKDYANHDFIYDWNSNIAFSSAPEGVKTYNKGYIDDAWLKIIAISPSIISDEELYSSGTGKVLTSFNYNVEFPKDNAPGDCRTRYRLEKSNEFLTIFLNGNKIGDSKITNFVSDEDMKFKAELKIQVVTKIRHYKKERYCCERDNEGDCTDYCRKCKYQNTEIKIHKLILTESKEALYYSSSIFPEIKAVNKNLNTVTGILDISGYSSFILCFEDSFYSKYNYYYDVNVSLKPYDVFTLRANKFLKKESNNINVKGIGDTHKFYVANPNDCKIRYYDHFNSYEQECNLNYDLPLLRIETDKLQYNEDETINVVLEPKDTEIRVKYAADEVLAENNVQFMASLNNNKITAQLNERETQTVIHIKRKDIWDLALNFGVFTSILYSLYLLFKKYVFFM